MELYFTGIGRMAEAERRTNGVLEWWSDDRKERDAGRVPAGRDLRPVAIQPFGRYHTATSLAHKPSSSRKKCNFFGDCCNALGISHLRNLPTHSATAGRPPRPNRSGARQSAALWIGNGEKPQLPVGSCFFLHLRPSA